jgi:predicted GIY-YIG superfamily endonuclease
MSGAVGSTVWIYVLLDKNRHFYVGITRRLRRRIAEHNYGRTRADRSHAPYTLVHREAFASYSEARKREKWLK